MKLFIIIYIGLIVMTSESISQNNTSSDSLQFPQVTSENLNGKSFTLPQDFEGKVNLIFIAFIRGQQQQINTWLPLAQELKSQHPEFFYYELPTISRLNPVSRWFINQGMRSGIQDEAARAITITLYLDKEEFKQALNITSEESITLLLVNDQGTVLWRTSGSWTEKGEHDMRGIISTHLN